MFRRIPALLLLLAAGGASLPAAERINHEGRLLGPVPPPLTAPILFNTPAADAVLSALQILPPDNAWNERIHLRPVLANSAAMIAQISADLGTSRQTLRAFYEMNYVLAPDAQPLQNINFLDYPDESDLNGGTNPLGRWPIPSSTPIEQWPLGTGSLTLAQWQQIANDDGSDRHFIVVQPGVGKIWETWRANLNGTQWEAACGALFPLNSNALRPDGWTSGDAGGLSMFSGLVRYDECARGMVEHALRIIVKRSRRAYFYPATHFASTLTGANYPAMGQRLRLRANFPIPAGWSVYEKAVALALKKYGAIVADNGGFLSVSVAPDDRFPANAFNNLGSIVVSDFEVIQTTGPLEGPRSPGAPVVNAGADQVIQWPAASAPLAAVNTTAGTPPLTWSWRTGAGPAAATFSNPAAAQASATFPLPGTYTLVCGADDGTHAIGWTSLRVETRLTAQVTHSPSDTRVSFPTAAGQRYRVQWCADAATGAWTTLADNLLGTGSPLEVPDSTAGPAPRRFYRVLALP